MNLIRPAEHGVEQVFDWKKTRIKSRNKTTSGADDAFGDAALLTLADESIPHGELALLFTVREETSMEGAKKLNFKGYDLSQCQALINVDWEKIGEAAIGSAAGGDSLLEMPIEREKIVGKKLVKIKISGGEGGHSGVDIHRSRANVAKELARCLQEIKGKTKLNIVSISAGEIKNEGQGENETPIRNAIPSSTEALIAIDPGQEGVLKSILRNQEKRIKKNYSEEKKLKISLEKTEETAEEMMTQDSTKDVLNLLTVLPHGVIDRGPDPLAGELTLKSTNLAIIRTKKESIRIDMSNRAVNEDKLEEVKKQIREIGQIFLTKVDEPEIYPACDQPAETDLFGFAKQIYEKVTGMPLKFTKVHGGLEFGYWKKFWPDMPMFAFGPTIDGPHSKNESMLVKTVPPTLEFLFSFVSSFAKGIGQ